MIYFENRIFCASFVYHSSRVEALLNKVLLYTDADSHVLISVVKFCRFVETFPQDISHFALCERLKPSLEIMLNFMKV